MLISRNFDRIPNLDDAHNILLHAHVEKYKKKVFYSIMFATVEPLGPIEYEPLLLHIRSLTTMV